MARTHAWLLHTGPPRRSSWLQRAWLWCRELLGLSVPSLTGPVVPSSVDSLCLAIERQLGKRYRCLPVIPRTGPTLDEAMRELQSGERVVLVPPLYSDPRTCRALSRRATRVLVDRQIQHSALAPWTDQDFLLEAQAWSHRMKCIACLKTRPQTDPEPEAPRVSQSPSFQQGLAEAIQAAERSAGWTVPEDWIRAAVARAWDAIDGGQSIEDATTLPDQHRPRLAWVDAFLQAEDEAEQEDA